MKLAIGLLGMFLMVAEIGQAQTSANLNPAGTETPAAAPEVSARGYTIFGSTSIQEAALRAQIQLMQPEILPLPGVIYAARSQRRYTPPSVNVKSAAENQFQGRCLCAYCRQL